MAKIKSYEELLDQVLDEIPEPKTIPAGSWRLRLNSATLQAPKDADKKPKALFAYKPVEPGEDVDDEAIQALGDQNPEDSTLFFTVFVEPGNGSDMAKLKRHIAKHGIDTTGMKIPEALKAIKNGEVVGLVSESIGKDGEPRNDVGNITALAA